MAPAEERHVARSWKPSMGISYIDYYLPESRVAIRDLVDREARADHSATRSHLSKYGERVEGSPASQLFAMHSNSNVFRTYRNTDRLEADIRQKWNIPYARVESGRTTLEAFKLLLDRFFDEAPVRPREINHLIYCSYNQNMYQADSACVPHELQEHYRMNRCTVTNVFRDCSSVMASIEYGESLIACGKAEHCLILCANFIEKMPRLLEFTVVSDAVALACLSRSAATAVLDHASLSTGTGREGQKDVLAIARIGVRMIEDLVRRNGLDMDRIDHIVTNNTNEVVYRDIYARLLDVPPDRLLSSNIADGGHCGNVDTLRNLKDIIDSSSSDPVKHIVLYNMGGTNKYLNWNTALLRSQPRP